MTPIYLDYAATTPVLPEVAEAMAPYFHEKFGNPSSIHRFGREIRLAIDNARKTVARILDCSQEALIFTSGGTESDNTAIMGVMLANREKGKHLITTQVEHAAVLDTCRFLQRMGYEVTYLPVDGRGRVDPDEVRAAIRPDTVLISVMYANNEVGTIQPVEAIGQIARGHGVYFHSDAVQALGAVPLRIGRMPVDMLSFSAHKIHGPKGIGALYAASDVPFFPHLMGGSQERKRRAGTENVAGIIGFAEALSISADHVDGKREHLLRLRRRMLSVWDEKLGGTYVINGHPEHFVPHILNVSFPGTDTETMLMNLDLHGIAASSGSACSAGSLQRSHVLIAMGLPDEVVNSAIRFSFGMNTTVEEVEHAAEIVAQLVERLRGKRRTAVR